MQDCKVLGTRLRRGPGGIASTRAELRVTLSIGLYQWDGGGATRISERNDLAGGEFADSRPRRIDACLAPTDFITRCIGKAGVCLLFMGGEDPITGPLCRGLFDAVVGGFIKHLFGGRHQIHTTAAAVGASQRWSTLRTLRR